MGETPRTEPVIDGYQALRAVAAAAGWPFCEEHKAVNDYRPGGCARHHRAPDPEHVYACEYPERDCICPPERTPR